MADDPLQETEVEICGKPYRVRPTFRLISAIETALGESCVTVGRRILNMQARTAELATVLSILAADEKGKGPSVQQVGEDLIKNGQRRYRESIANFLMAVYLGDEEFKKAVSQDPQTPAPG